MKREEGERKKQKRKENNKNEIKCEQIEGGTQKEKKERENIANIFLKKNAQFKNSFYL